MARVVSDSAALLIEAKEAIIELARMKEYRDQLKLDQKRFEKALASEKKAVSDSISVTVKKRIEEINDSYDKEIGKDQDRLKKIRAKREKAKNQGVKERIEEETAELRDHNKELRSQMRSIFRQNRVPKFCDSTLYYSIYFTKGLKEGILFLLLVLVCFLGIPCGIYFLLPQATPVYLIGIYFGTILIFGGAYVMINNITKVKHLDALKKGRTIRNIIAANNRKIKVIAAGVRRDKSDDAYELDHYDAEIAKVESSLNEIVKKKKEALNTFDTVTAGIIADEISGNSRERIEGLESDLYGVTEELRELEENIKNGAITITDSYEVYIGKDFMQPDKLEALLQIIEDGSADNISEAISIYKNSTK